MDVLGNNKLIFIFGSVTQPPPYRLQKGEQFLLGLLKHNLRISVEGSCSDIDHNKSACNLLRLSDTERWTTAVSHEDKNNYFCQVKKKYHQILKKFQQQLQAQNVVYQQRSQYDQIKT